MKSMSNQDILERLAAVVESRKPANGGDPEKSYVARLLHKGPDAFLKKIGEEATEVVMAAKEADHGGDLSHLVGEMADLWFHCLIALAEPGPPQEAVVQTLFDAYFIEGQDLTQASVLLALALQLAQD